MCYLFFAHCIRQVQTPQAAPHLQEAGGESHSTLSCFCNMFLRSSLGGSWEVLGVLECKYIKPPPTVRSRGQKSLNAKWFLQCVSEEFVRRYLGSLGRALEGALRSEPGGPGRTWEGPGGSLEERTRKFLTGSWEALAGSWREP